MTSSCARCGWSDPVGSWRITRATPSSGSCDACSTSGSVSPVGPELYTRPAGELGARGGDRLGGLAEIRDVVQRIVEPEDLDPVLRSAGDEPSDEVGVDRVRAHEEPAAQRHRERCLHARFDGANPLPGALEAAPYGRVEDAAARDLEVAEARSVENLGDMQEIRRRNPLGKRVLPEQPDGRVD